MSAGAQTMSTDAQAFTRVRTIKKLQVFSPTRENRETFGREMAAKYNIEVRVCDRPEEVYKGAHILAAVTDSAPPLSPSTCPYTKSGPCWRSRFRCATRSHRR